jgi:hypothetical protein
MKYKVEEVKESIDLIVLSADEVDRFNKILIETIKTHFPRINESEIGPVSKFIITDGFHRAELKVKKEDS